MCLCLVLFVKFLHNIFHNVKIASSGEIDYSVFTVCFPFKDNSFMGLGFFNPTLRLRHWDVMSFCMQLGNSEDR